MFADQDHVRRAQTVLRLASPLIIFMLSQTLMGLVDTKLVASLGPQALGGVGLASALLNAAIIGVLGLMRGVKVLSAHAHGSGRPQDSQRVALVGLGVAVVAGVVWTLSLMQAMPLLPRLAVSAELLPATQAYLSARLWGLPASFMVAALLEYRQGCGDVRSSMWVGLGGNLVNGVLAYGLIHGRWGLPAEGVWGAGFGTALTEWVQALALGTYVLRQIWAAPPPAADVAPIGYVRALVELTRVGLPTALQVEFEYLALALCILILSKMEADMAAHQIALVINRIAYLPGLAVGEAVCILVAGALGASRLDLADRWVYTCLWVGAVLMVSIGACLVLAGEPLARLFSSDLDIIARTRGALALAGFYQLMDSVNIVMRGALRGAKDVRVPAFWGVGVLWTCVPTLTWFLGRTCGWGVLGAWSSFLVVTVICALIFSYRWYYGSWRLAILEPDGEDLSPRPLLAAASG